MYEVYGDSKTGSVWMEKNKNSDITHLRRKEDLQEQDYQPCIEL